MSPCWPVSNPPDGSYRRARRGRLLAPSVPASLTGSLGASGWSVPPRCLSAESHSAPRQTAGQGVSSDPQGYPEDFSGIPRCRPVFTNMPTGSAIPLIRGLEPTVGPGALSSTSCSWRAGDPLSSPRARRTTARLWSHWVACHGRDQARPLLLAGVAQSLQGFVRAAHCLQGDAEVFWLQPATSPDLAPARGRWPSPSGGTRPHRPSGPDRAARRPGRSRRWPPPPHGELAAARGGPRPAGRPPGPRRRRRAGRRPGRGGRGRPAPAGRARRRATSRSARGCSAASAKSPSTRWAAPSAASQPARSAALAAGPASANASMAAAIASTAMTEVASAARPEATGSRRSAGARHAPEPPPRLRRLGRTARRQAAAVAAASASALAAAPAPELPAGDRDRGRQGRRGLRARTAGVGLGFLVHARGLDDRLRWVRRGRGPAFAPGASPGACWSRARDLIRAPPGPTTAVPVAPRPGRRTRRELRGGGSPSRFNPTGLLTRCHHRPTFSRNRRYADRHTSRHRRQCRGTSITTTIRGNLCRTIVRTTGPSPSWECSSRSCSSPPPVAAAARAAAAPPPAAGGLARRAGATTIHVGFGRRGAGRVQPA